MVTPLLTIEKGLTDQSVVLLQDTPHVLGRNTKDGTSFDSPFISTRHAQIELIGESYHIRDLGSKNGTFVNGQPIGDDVKPLVNGDRIELAGGQVALTFHIPSGGDTLRLPSPKPAQISALSVDEKTRDVHLKGQLIDPPLTKREFDVLLFLYQRSGQVCKKDDIASYGWPERETGDVSDQEIQQCIRRIRVRLETSPSKPVYVKTVPGVGYRFVNP